MYPVVMYHFPNFFPDLFPDLLPQWIFAKKGKKQQFLTNILGFSRPFLGVSVLETYNKM